MKEKALQVVYYHLQTHTPIGYGYVDHRVQSGMVNIEKADSGVGLLPICPRLKHVCLKFPPKSVFWVRTPTCLCDREKKRKLEEPRERPFEHSLLSRRGV